MVRQAHYFIYPAHQRLIDKIKSLEPVGGQLLSSAEGVGLEPTKALRPASFQDWWNNQLSDPSKIHLLKSFLMFRITSTDDSEISPDFFVVFQLYTSAITNHRTKI